MKRIRQNVFETNSSSTHSLQIVKKDEWDKFKNGELYFSIDDLEFLTQEEIGKQYQDCYKRCKTSYDTDIDMIDFDEWCNENKFYTYESAGYWYEFLTKNTPDGEHVAISIYGSNC